MKASILFVMALSFCLSAVGETHAAKKMRPMTDLPVETDRHYYVDEVEITDAGVQITLESGKGRVVRASLQKDHPYREALTLALTAAMKSGIRTEAVFNEDGTIQAIELERGPCGMGELASKKLRNIRLQRLEIQTGQLEMVMANDRGEAIGKITLPAGERGRLFFGSLIQAMEKDLLVDVSTNADAVITSLRVSNDTFRRGG